MPRKVTLNRSEIVLLDLQDPATENKGGFQSLMVKLQRQLDRDTNEILLDDNDLARIPRYAFKYQNGGWQNRLEGIFNRTLGTGLGRGSNSG
jgi:hypothetical protein